MKESFIVTLDRSKVDDPHESDSNELAENDEEDCYLAINHDRFLQEFK